MYIPLLYIFRTTTGYRTSRNDPELHFGYLDACFWVKSRSNDVLLHLDYCCNNGASRRNC